MEAMGKTRRGRLLGWQGKQVQNQAQCGRWGGPELLPGSWEQPLETYFAAPVRSFARALYCCFGKYSQVTHCVSLAVLGPRGQIPIGLLTVLLQDGVLSFGLRQPQKEQIVLWVPHVGTKGEGVIIPGDTRKGLLEEGGHTELWNRGMGRKDTAGRGHLITKGRGWPEGWYQLLYLNAWGWTPRV